MGYRHTSRSNRRPARTPDGYVMRENKYAATGECCGTEVRPGEGIAVKDGPSWSVSHKPARWTGSPVSGRYTGGCEYYRARASQDAAYATYTGNIAWSALCDEGAGNER
jgi:hypothetical protein